MKRVDLRRVPVPFYWRFGRDVMRMDGYELFIGIDSHPELSRTPGTALLFRYALSVRFRKPLEVNWWRVGRGERQFSFTVRTPIHWWWNSATSLIRQAQGKRP